MASRVSMKQIAEVCGLSVNSVSLALRNSPRIAPETRERVRKAAGKLGYERDPLVSAGMARLRSTGASPGSFIAVIAEMPRRQFSEAEAMQGVYRGLSRHAAAHGFKLERFHPFDDGLRFDRLRQILRSRNAYGLVLLFSSEALGPTFQRLIRDFPVCSVGHRFRDPPICNICTDHYAAARMAVVKVLSMGYRRPGLILDDDVDRALENRYHGGFTAGVRDLPKSKRLEPLRAPRATKADLGELRQLGKTWFSKTRPDVVLTNQIIDHPEVFLDRFGLPEKHPCLRINLQASNSEWTGVVNPYETVGAAAVNQLVTLLHRGEHGPQSRQSILSIMPDWWAGNSCPPPHP